MAQLDELDLTTLASALLVSTVFVLPDSPIRIVLGLPFILFFPGYALVAALYPRREDLDVVERLALSLALSLAIVPLIGLLLNLLPWGIRPGPILIALTVFTAICSGLAKRNRGRLPWTERFGIEIAPLISQTRSMSWFQIGAAVVVVASIVFVSWGMHVIKARNAETFTEFYALGSSGKADSYPRQVVVGQSASVILGVVNHELRQVTYRITIRENGLALAALDPVTLGNGQKWEQAVWFSPTKPGDHERIVFFLFKDSSPGPYRRLYLWMRVLSPQAHD